MDILDIYKNQSKNKKRQFIYNEKKHQRFIETLQPYLFSDNSSPEQIVLLRLVIDNENDLENQDVIFFDVINESMAHADINFFTRAVNYPNMKNDDSYAPYIYGIAIDNTKKIKKLIQNKKLFRNGYKSGIPCKIFPRKYSKESIKRINGRYYIPAIEFFAASPFRTNGIGVWFNFKTNNEEEKQKIRRLKKLVAQIDKLDIINKYIKPNICHTKSDIETIMSEKLEGSSNLRLEDLFPDKSFDGFFKIYNVGQGFCASLCAKEKQILFDIGLDKRKFSEKLQGTYSLSRKQRNIIDENYKTIAKYETDIVILSHWDMDHILGICNIDGIYRPELWIAPDITERKKNRKTGTISISLQRLLVFLTYYKKLIMVGREFNAPINKDAELVWGNKFLSIYKCNTNIKEKGKYKNTINNNQSLLITILNQIIIPGDASYLAWPKQLNMAEHNYDYLIVPHHGGRAGELPKPIKQISAGNKWAIFSYGKSNRYHHPYKNYTHRLKEEYHYERINTKDIPCIILCIHYDGQSCQITLR